MKISLVVHTIALIQVLQVPVVSKERKLLRVMTLKVCTSIEFTYVDSPWKVRIICAKLPWLSRWIPRCKEADEGDLSVLEEIASPVRRLHRDLFARCIFRTAPFTEAPAGLTALVRLIELGRRIPLDRDRTVDACEVRIPRKHDARSAADECIESPSALANSVKHIFRCLKK